MSDLRHNVVTAILAAASLLALSRPAFAVPRPAGALASSSPPASALPATSTVTISGRGFGHGVGMAQDGDLALGKQGKSMPQILGEFYPGTRFGSLGDVPIRAAVLQVAARDAVTVQLPSGGTVRAGTSGVSVKPGGSVSITYGSGAYTARLLDPPTSLRKDQRSASGTNPYSVYSSGLEVIPATGRSYRGVLTAVADGTYLRAINTLPIETYLDGLGEVRDPSWPAASLQALAVAARTYAIHSMHPGAIFDVWDDDRSQVYLGAGAEYPELTAAVHATRGLVLTYDGAVADTVYSASGGGITATATEGFGDSASQAATEPYLVASAYPTADPQPWSITLSLAAVAARLDYPGSLTGMTVTSTGPSGRPTAVTLTGSAGARVVSGIDVYSELQLRSTLFTLAAGAPGAAISPIGAGGSEAAGPSLVAATVGNAARIVPTVAPTTLVPGTPAAAPAASAPPTSSTPSAPASSAATTSAPPATNAAPAEPQTPIAQPTTRAPVATTRAPVATSIRLLSDVRRERAASDFDLARDAAIPLWLLALCGFAASVTQRRNKPARVG